MNNDRILAELRKPAAKRHVGHDRDPLGFLILVEALSDQAAEENAELLANCQLPARIDCLTCRFHDRQWAGEPCHSCLDDYTVQYPYPKWRRA
jgi:hypothetical protein